MDWRQGRGSPVAPCSQTEPFPGWARPGMDLSCTRTGLCHLSLLPLCHFCGLRACNRRRKPKEPRLEEAGMGPVRREHRGGCSASCRAATVRVWVNWGARMGLLLEGGTCRDMGLGNQKGGEQGVH